MIQSTIDSPEGPREDYILTVATINSVVETLTATLEVVQGLHEMI